MDILSNPFVLLNASTRDSKKRLIELEEDLSSSATDSRSLRDARSQLTKPKSRLSAELSFLPGVSPSKQREIVSRCQENPAAMAAPVDLPPLCKCNLISCSLLEISKSGQQSLLKQAIVQLGVCFEEVSAEKLILTLNEDRELAGIPMVRDVESLKSELDSRKSQFISVSNSALNQLYSNELVDILTEVVNESTIGGAQHPPVIIEGVVDGYETVAQNFFDNEEQNISTLIGRIEEMRNGGSAEADVLEGIDRLGFVVRNWDRVAQPIQLVKMSQGLTHKNSRETARKLRTLAISIYNDDRMLEASKRLTEIQIDVFAEVPEALVEARTDHEALAGIQTQEEELKKAAAFQQEKLRLEMRYSTEVGVAFKSKLEINYDKIKWNRQEISHDGIKNLTWGGTSNSINGIPTGTVYEILIAGESENIRIETRRQEVYTEVIARLWKRAVVRLLSEMGASISTGNGLAVNNISIKNESIVFSIKKGILSNAQVYTVPWNRIAYYEGPGYFQVSDRNDNTVYAQLSYLQTPNAHVIKALINAQIKSGLNSIAELFAGV